MRAPGWFGDAAGTWYRRLPDALTLLLTGWLLWPQRVAGYGLGHDMVFTPNQPLNGGSVGLGSTPPRAVPLDALVALTGKVVGGAITGRIALLVPLLLAGWGAVRLLDSLRAPPFSPPARLLAAGAAVWNPFVVERLALGQWALLWCYGALPWLVRAARRRDWLAAGLALAAAAITPTGAVIGAITLLVAGCGRAGWWRPVGLAVLAQLPWLVPALTSTASATSDPRAVAAFAARAERPGGAVLSLLGLGGVWNADVTPASRAGTLGFLTTAAVLIGLILGARAVPRRLLALGGAGLLLAALATVPGGAGLVRWAVRAVPGAGLLRDGQKWLLPAVLVAVLAAAAALDRLRWRPVLVGVAAVALPLLLLPDGPVTLRTPLQPVHYPAGWAAAARLVRGSQQAVLVLPFASYRSFDWAPGRTVLDPAPRLLDAPVLTDDRLVVGQQVLGGEDPAVPAYLAKPNDLAAQGIGWVLVEGGTPGPIPTELSRLSPRLDTPAVQLYQVPGPVTGVSSGSARKILIVGVDMLVAAATLLALAWKSGQRLRPLLHSPVTSAGSPD